MTSGKARHGRVCGAKLVKPMEDGRTTCENTAGYGTDHPGFGLCKWHFGSVPSQVRNARRLEAEEMVRVLRVGQPLEISPDQALLGEVHRTAGVVAWLEWSIGEQFDMIGDVIYLTDQGVRLGAFHEVWLKERAHLAKVAKLALDAGVAERQVRIAEEQGAIIARLIKAVLGDLDLTPEQRAQAPDIVHRHLMAIPA